VPELIDAPVVNSLREKKEERQDAQESQTSLGRKHHSYLSSPITLKKQRRVLTRSTQSLA